MAVLLLVLVWGVTRGPQTFSFYWYEYLNRKHLAEFEAMEEAYRTDTNGADTPGKTLDLFIEALEAGEAELAASYFVPEKRGEMEKQFKAGFESGGVELLLGDLKKIEKGTSVNGDRHEFVVLENNQVLFSYSLVKNTYSQKWLIESL